MRRFFSLSGAAAVAVAVWAAPALAAPPANQSAPTITGTPKVGAWQTARNGTWSGSPNAFEYQWQRCNAAGAACTAIPRAVERVYLPAAADAGKTLRVVVTASNAEGSASARSAQTGVIAPSTAPQSTAKPTISGEAEVGQQLTGSEGTWTGTPTRYQYLWLRCDVDGFDCMQIQMAGGKRYQVRAADVGSRLVFRVIASNADGAGMAFSDPSDFVIPSTPVKNTRPALTLLSAKFVGTKLYVRFRVCDDIAKNLRIYATDSKGSFKPQTRIFSTRIPPNPCGVYTRKWTPAKKYRTKGRYVMTLQVRDDTELRSNLVRKTFVLR